MERKKIILPTQRYAKSPEEESTIRLPLIQSENLLRENDRNIVIDVAELYNKERNDSKKYLIHGKIKVVFSNEYIGTVEYEYLKNNLYLLSYGEVGDNEGIIPYNEFAFLRNDIFRQYNTPNSGDNISFTPNLNVTEQYTGHTIVTSETAPYQNWNIYLSYVYDIDTGYSMTYTLSDNTSYKFVADDGIPFIINSNDRYYTLTSPIYHGMNSGEYIIISGGTITSLTPEIERTFYIHSIGNDTYNSENYVINILKTEFAQNVSFQNGTVILGKRCINKNDIENTKSKYYVHKHKTLTDINDYILDNLGFESTIWRDEKKLLYENSAGVNDFLVEKNRMESLVYSFKNPFVLTGITNNLGYTPTEVYLSVIYRNGNGYFEYPPKVGYKFNFHDTWIDKQFSGNTSLETNITSTTFTKTENNTIYNFKSGNTLNIGTTLIGAFVEYNPHEFKERIISEAYHKIVYPTNIFNHNQDDANYYSGASINNKVGIYYQPHYRIKLRELSPYLEISNTKDIINLPENAKYYQNENLWKWRDLYEHGYVDTDGYGTNFPFINGLHYVNRNINFYIRNEKLYTNKKEELKKFINKIIDC